jgi:hypothetical protein
MVSVMCDETGPVGRIPPGNALSLVEWDAVLWDGNGFFQGLFQSITGVPCIVKCYVLREQTW